MLFLLLMFPCFAQFANYNSIILGDRAAGLGGAGTALLNDTSSAAYYNPALLSASEGSAFSAAVGIYKKYDIQYGSELDYTQTPLKVSSGFFRSLPASTGNLIRKNDWTFGLSILVPEFETFKGDLQNTDTNVSTLTFTDETLWVGGTLAHPISERSSAGVTLYYTARNFIRSVQDRSHPNAASSILFNSEETLTENAVVPVLGYLYRPRPDWTLGASLRYRGIQVSSHAKYFESLLKTDPYTSTEISKTALESKVFIPTKLSLGFTKTFEDRWLLTSSLDIYEGFTYKMMDYMDKGALIVRNAVANFSIGVEKEFTDWFKIRVGVFSNFSPYPDPDPNLKRPQGERVDQGGFSANAVFIADNKIAYTFGGYYTGGRGRSIQRVDQDYHVMTKSQHVFTMLTGTQFYF